MAQLIKQLNKQSMKHHQTEQHSPQSNSTTFKQYMFHSHKHVNESNDNSEQWILRENRQALNLSNFTIVDQSMIKPKRRVDKENRPRPRPTSPKHETVILIPDTKFCTVCYLAGPMVPLCRCKLVHKTCLAQFQGTLPDPLKPDSLFCCGCRTYYHVKITNEFDTMACSRWRNLVICAAIIIVMLGLLGLLMATIASNKDMIYVNSYLFALALVACMMLFVTTIWVSIYMVQMFQRWRVTVVEFNEDLRAQNTQTIQLLKTLNNL